MGRGSNEGIRLINTPTVRQGFNSPLWYMFLVHRLAKYSVIGVYSAEMGANLLHTHYFNISGGERIIEY